MRTDRRQFGMTLLEVLVTLTVILILVGALGGVGVHLKKQAEIRLTEGTIDVLVTAIEQFYDSTNPGTFPFETRDDDGDGVAHEYQTLYLETDLNGTVVNPADHPDEYASSEMLYYRLSQNPDSARFIDTLSDVMISNKAPNGNPLYIDVTVGTETNRYDLIRFIDAWGMPIRYAYDPVLDAFPILTSAGPDKTFDSPDDIRNE